MRSGGLALAPSGAEERRYSARTVVVLAPPEPEPEPEPATAPALPSPAPTLALMALLLEVAQGR